MSGLRGRKKFVRPFHKRIITRILMRVHDGHDTPNWVRGRGQKGFKPGLITFSFRENELTTEQGGDTSSSKTGFVSADKSMQGKGVNE